MTIGRYFKAWIIFFLIATVGGGIVGAAVGGVLGGMLGLFRVDLDRIKAICQVVGLLISVPISFGVFYWVTSHFLVKPLQAAAAVKSPVASPPVVPPPAV